MALRLNPPSGRPPLLGKEPGSLPRIKNSAWIIVGGGLVLLGSYLPFIHSNTADLGFTETVSGSRLMFPAVVLISAGICVCWAPRRWPLVASITSLIVSLLYSLLLLSVIVAGTVGWTVPTDYGVSYKVTLSIGAGLILALAGFAAAAVGSIKSIRQRKT